LTPSLARCNLKIRAFFKEIPMRLFPATLAAALSLASASTAFAQVPTEAVFAAAKAVQPKVVAWRRDIHQHP
jgi:hypothetical protein